MARVLFLHGLESGPLGTKARWLREHYGAACPQLDTSSFDAALTGARAAVAVEAPSILVGSSYGGALAVALLASGEWRGPTVLIAPAARLLGVMGTPLPGARVLILHGTDDDVVPVADSRAMAAQGGPGVELREIAGGDHRLNRVLDDGTLHAALAELGVV